MQKQASGILEHITIGLQLWEVFRQPDPMSSHSAACNSLY